MLRFLPPGCATGTRISYRRRDSQMHTYSERSVPLPARSSLRADGLSLCGASGTTAEQTPRCRTVSPSSISSVRCVVIPSDDEGEVRATRRICCANQHSQRAMCSSQPTGVCVRAIDLSRLSRRRSAAHDWRALPQAGDVRGGPFCRSAPTVGRLLARRPPQMRRPPTGCKVWPRAVAV